MRNRTNHAKDLGYFVLGLASLISLVALQILTPLLPLSSKVRFSSPNSPAASEAASEETRSRLSEAYGKLPLSFEANQGQSDAEVKFLSRGSGYSLFLNSNEAVLSLNPPQSGPKTQRADHYSVSLSAASASRALRSSTVRMKLLGANPVPQTTGIEELPGKVNYFIGDDPAKWRTNIPTYARVKQENIYPGVDLVYYGNQRQLEYDFIVAPGADPMAITLGFEGADKVELDPNGSLILYAAGGEVIQRSPNIYQEINGARRTISGSYALLDPQEFKNQRLGFEIGAYDVTRPLIIDPVLVYSTYLGGGGGEDAFGGAVAVDGTGAAYITGDTNGGFPTINPLQPNPGGGVDVFVAKLNPTGSALVYSTYLGGSFPDVGAGIAVDSAGSAYVTGVTDSPDFPTMNPFQPAHAGIINNDGFVAKLSPDGSALIYSTYLGGIGNDQSLAIAVDTAGNAHVTGWTVSLDDPATPQNEGFPTKNAFQPTLGGSVNRQLGRLGGSDAFVAKLNATGSDLVYSTYLGGDGSENDNFFHAGIAVDTAGNAYVTGVTFSTDNPNTLENEAFPTTVGAFQTTCVLVNGFCSGDAFVSKFSPAGGLVYSTLVGGSNLDQGLAIAVDSAHNAYITGFTDSSDFPTANPFQPALHGARDVFVTKLNTTGSALVYSTYLGGSISTFQGEVGYAIAADTAGNAYVAGVTDSIDFPTLSPLQATNNGGGDAFVTKLNAAGSALTYSTYLGGGGGETAYGIAVDASGAAYVTGAAGLNFPTTPEGFQTAFGGGTDAFVAKIADTSTNTPAGNNVTVQLGAVTITFANVTVSGNTTVTPIDPNSAGALPGGFVVFNSLAFDITTTAIVSSPITVCFTASSATDAALFSSLRVFHREAGILVDKTILAPDSPAPDFGTRTLCARVNSLSPFLVAQRISNRAPVARCKDVEVAVGSSCTASVSASDINNGSFDPDPADTITLTLSSSGPFSLGAHAVTLTATDNHGASSACNATITVVDRTPPAITSCPTDKTLSANVACQAAIPDLTREISATDNCTAASNLAITQSPSAGTPVSVGSTTVTITVTDASGNTATCTAAIRVVDTTPPSVTASLAAVGKVQKKEGKFQVRFSATDNCTSSPTVLAVMEIPTGAGGFPVVFEKENDDEAKITFDLKKRRIILEGRDELTMRALLAQAFGDGGVAVAQSQQLQLQLQNNQRFEFIFSTGALIKVKAPALRLKVTARDTSGNVSEATAIPVFAVK